MTTSDYATIRHRLDHPQMVVWDPCAVTLAEADPAWPAPLDGEGIERLVGELSTSVSPIVRLVAASIAVRVWIDTCDRRAGVRDILDEGYSVVGSDELFDRDLPWRVLCYLDHELTDAPLPPSVERDRNELLVNFTRSGSVASLRERYIEVLSTFSFDLEHWSDADDISSLEAVLDSREPDHVCVLSAARAANLRIQSDPAAATAQCIGNWWARCRARLAFNDVATAEIEWGAATTPTGR